MVQRIPLWLGAEGLELLTLYRDGGRRGTVPSHIRNLLYTPKSPVTKYSLNLYAGVSLLPIVEQA